MNIVLIGAGNLATSLGVALKKANHNVVQVYSRTDESAKALADKLGTTYTSNLRCLRDDADIYFVSVTDSALQSVFSSRETFSLLSKEGSATPLIVHTAGSIPMDVLPCERRGVFYPMQTFSKKRIVDFELIPVFVEASNADDEASLEQLAKDLSKNVYKLSSKDRIYLHLAAVFCSNFVNHCYALSDEILTEHNIPFSVMLPLIDEVAAKVHNVIPKDAQTGPAIRHDMNVVNKHLDMLADNPHIQNIYKLLSNSIAND